MKKILSIVAVAAALVSGLMFTGCDVAEDFVAPKDTWVYKTGKTDNSFTYTWGEGAAAKTVNFDVYVNYATKDATVSFKGEGTGEVKPGLNVILVPKAETESEKASVKALFELGEYVGDLAVFYSYGTKPKADNAGTEKDINISGTTWTLIYNFNRFESMGSKSMSNTTSGLTLVKDLKNLNIKRVLYNMIGDKLFSE